MFAGAGGDVVGQRGEHGGLRADPMTPGDAVEIVVRRHRAVLEAVAPLAVVPAAERGQHAGRVVRETREPLPLRRADAFRVLVAGRVEGVIGKGPLREHLEQRAIDLGLRGRVHFDPFLPRIELSRAALPVRPRDAW
ncbi:hypothetical protein [Streptomyces sp. NPDC094014]|uniref:hypothetical protein n=2 Tax=unclassified Streptomyces TaxID=2593676 RepID=UPI003419C807